MASNIIATIRMTRHYVDSCSHLDKWGREYRFKMLQGRQIRPPDGYDDGGSCLVRVIGSKTLNQDAQANALRDTLGYGGCAHEHDCCGCKSVHAQVTKVKRGIFSVLLRTSYNY